MQKSEISSKRAFIEPSEFFFEKIFSFLSVKHTLVLRKIFFRALGAHSVEKKHLVGISVKIGRIWLKKFQLLI